MNKFILIFLLALLAGMPAHAITVSSCSFNNPNADRFFGWDQSEGKCNIFTPGSGLVFSGTSVSVSGLTVSEFSSPNISQWTNNAGYLAGLGSSSINDLSDVNLTGLTDGELLVSASGIFINNTLAEAGIAAASHAHASSDITSGTFANARISQGSVTQHEAALSLTASQISDFDAEVSSNTDVAANTLARHDAASVTDSSEVDFTLAAQNITASLKNGSIDETRLDTSTNASLDLADTSLQAGDNISDLVNDEGYIIDLSEFTTADLPDSTNKRYVTDAQLTVIGNTSNINTGDQTSVTGNAGTATALAANGANCSSGQAPLGVGTDGAAESCFDVWTEAENTAAAYNRKEYCLALSDQTTNLATGAGKATLFLPSAATVHTVRAWVNTAPTGSTIIVDINEAGTSLMTTIKLSIDASEKTSGTAASAAVLTDTAIAANAEITLDIDQVGSTIAGKGLVACLGVSF